MAAGIGARFAGKALNDFLKVAMGAVGSAAQQKTLDYLAGKADYADAPGLLGKLAANPERVAGLVGAAAPLAAAGGIAGAGLLGQRMLQGPPGGYDQQIMTERHPLYSQQPFVPGTVPFTNAQASEVMLEQMKLQNQLQVIQARQSASQPQGMAYSNPYGDRISKLTSTVYNY
jgi:hypothetical protein